MNSQGQGRDLEAYYGDSSNINTGGVGEVGSGVSNLNDDILPPQHPIHSTGGVPFVKAWATQTPQISVVAVPIQPQRLFGFQNGTVTQVYPSDMPNGGRNRDQVDRGLLPASNNPTGVDNNNHWNVTLFSKCCECSGFCCTSWLCSWVVVALAHGRLANVTTISDGMGEGGTEKKRHKLNEFLTIAVILFICTCLGMGGAGLILSLYVSYTIFKLLGQVRQIYKIKEGNPCCDCFNAFFCQPCAIIRLAYQIWDEPRDVPGGCSCDDKAVFARSNNPRLPV